MNGSTSTTPDGPWTAAWFGLAALAVVNGGVRERVLVPRLGERRAHQVATGLLVAGIWGSAAALSRVRPLPDRHAARRVGLAWAVSTVGFETVMGLARRVPLRRMLADYDVRDGRAWVLVPASMALAPVAVTRPA